MTTTSSFAASTRTRIIAALAAVSVGVVGVVAEAASPTPIARIMPNLSYVRLANMADSGAAVHTVEVYGLSTKTTLGRFQVEVPAKASVQIHPVQMLNGLPASELDQFMALYVTTGRDKQSWQHVRFDGTTGAFSDTTVCATPATNAAALNVHTSRIAQYVSFVTAHNYGDQAGRYEARVHDAANGARLGVIDVELAPRQTLSENGMWFQNTIGLFFPRDDQLHLNIEFVEKGNPTGARLTVGHEVYDVVNKTSVNLSATCAI